MLKLSKRINRVYEAPCREITCTVSSFWNLLHYSSTSVYNHANANRRQLGAGQPQSPVVYAGKGGFGQNSHQNQAVHGLHKLENVLQQKLTEQLEKPNNSLDKMTEGFANELKQAMNALNESNELRTIFLLHKFVDYFFERPKRKSTHCDWLVVWRDIHKQITSHSAQSPHGMKLPFSRNDFNCFLGFIRLLFVDMPSSFTTNLPGSVNNPDLNLDSAKTTEGETLGESTPGFLTGGNADFHASGVDCVVRWGRRPSSIWIKMDKGQKLTLIDSFIRCSMPVTASALLFDICCHERMDVHLIACLKELYQRCCNTLEKYGAEESAGRGEFRSLDVSSLALFGKLTSERKSSVPSTVVHLRIGDFILQSGRIFERELLTPNEYAAWLCASTTILWAEEQKLKAYKKLKDYAIQFLINAPPTVPILPQNRIALMESLETLSLSELCKVGLLLRCRQVMRVHLYLSTVAEYGQGHFSDVDSQLRKTKIEHLMHFPNDFCDFTTFREPMPNPSYVLQQLQELLLLFDGDAQSCDSLLVGERHQTLYRLLFTAGVDIPETRRAFFRYSKNDLQRGVASKCKSHSPSETCSAISNGELIYNIGCNPPSVSSPSSLLDYTLRWSGRDMFMKIPRSQTNDIPLSPLLEELYFFENAFQRVIQRLLEQQPRDLMAESTQCNDLLLLVLMSSVASPLTLIYSKSHPLQHGQFYAAMMPLLCSISQGVQTSQSLLRQMLFLLTAARGRAFSPVIDTVDKKRFVSEMSQRPIKHGIRTLQSIHESENDAFILGNPSKILKDLRASSVWSRMHSPIFPTGLPNNEGRIFGTCFGQKSSFLFFSKVNLEAVAIKQLIRSVEVIAQKKKSQNAIMTQKSFWSPHKDFFEALGMMLPLIVSAKAPLLLRNQLINAITSNKHAHIHVNTVIQHILGTSRQQNGQILDMLNKCRSELKDEEAAFLLKTALRPLCSGLHTDMQPESLDAKFDFKPYRMQGTYPFLLSVYMPQDPKSVICSSLNQDRNSNLTTASRFLVETSAVFYPFPLINGMSYRLLPSLATLFSLPFLSYDKLGPSTARLLPLLLDSACTPVLTEVQPIKTACYNVEEDVLKIQKKVSALNAAVTESRKISHKLRHTNNFLGACIQGIAESFSNSSSLNFPVLYPSLAVLWKKKNQSRAIQILQSASASARKKTTGTGIRELCSDNTSWLKDVCSIPYVPHFCNLENVNSKGIHLHNSSHPLTAKEAGEYECIPAIINVLRKLLGLQPNLSGFSQKADSTRRETLESVDVLESSESITKGNVDEKLIEGTSRTILFSLQPRDLALTLTLLDEELRFVEFEIYRQRVLRYIENPPVGSATDSKGEELKYETEPLSFSWAPLVLLENYKLSISETYDALLGHFDRAVEAAHPVELEILLTDLSFIIRVPEGLPVVPVISDTEPPAYISVTFDASAECRTRREFFTSCVTDCLIRKFTAEGNLRMERTELKFSLLHTVSSAAFASLFLRIFCASSATWWAHFWTVIGKEGCLGVSESFYALLKCMKYLPFGDFVNVCVSFARLGFIGRSPVTHQKIPTEQWMETKALERIDKDASFSPRNFLSFFPAVPSHIKKPNQEDDAAAFVFYRYLWSSVYSQLRELKHKPDVTQVVALLWALTYLGFSTDHLIKIPMQILDLYCQDRGHFSSFINCSDKFLSNSRFASVQPPAALQHLPSELFAIINTTRLSQVNKAFQRDCDPIFISRLASKFPSAFRALNALDCREFNGKHVDPSFGNNVEAAVKNNQSMILDSRSGDSMESANAFCSENEDISNICFDCLSSVCIAQMLVQRRPEHIPADSDNNNSHNSSFSLKKSNESVANSRGKSENWNKSDKEENIKNKIENFDEMKIWYLQKFVSSPRSYYKNIVFYDKISELGRRLMIGDFK